MSAFLFGALLAFLLGAWFYEAELGRAGASLGGVATRQNGDNGALSQNRTGRTGVAVVPQQRYEAPEIGAMLRRMARAMVRRAAEGDLEAVSVLAEVHTAIGEAIADGARAAHARGYSWAEVGAELGISRQAARQRFAATDERAGA